MANSKTITAKHSQYFWVDMTITDTKDDSAAQKSTLEWTVDLTHYRLVTSSKITITVKVDGTSYSYTHAAINSGSGKHTTNLCTGSAKISHTAKKDVSFSFEVKFGSNGWTIDGSLCKSLSKSGTITLPQLAVSPTLPTSIDIWATNGNYVDVDNPKFSVSWSGAKAGTYTIKNYNIQCSVYNKNNWSTEKTVTTDATSGSANNVPINNTSISAGNKVQVRVGLRTTDDTHWGYITSSETLTVYSNPTSPSTISYYETVAIDDGFSVSWSGATAGSLGIAGYDFEGRAYNGSSWTAWTNIFSKNATSWSCAKIADLKIAGVGYSNYGENVKFQFRVRTYDGIVGKSYDYTTTGETRIVIYSPNNPSGAYISSGVSGGQMKPQTQITLNWNTPYAGSGTISGYDIVYTTNNDVSYITAVENWNSTSYSFTPNVAEGQTLRIYVRAKNSYGKYSGWTMFPDTRIYVDGKSVAKINNTLSNIRGYVKVNDSMHKIQKIYVKVNNRMYQIDQF